MRPPDVTIGMSFENRNARKSAYGTLRPDGQGGDRHGIDQRHWAGNSAENLGWLRKLALCLLKAEKSRSSKGKSIATRRLIAGWKNDYLLTVLAQITEKSGA